MIGARTANVLVPVLVLGIGAASCDTTTAVGDEPGLADRITAAREYMHARYAGAKTAQLALAVGDLERTRTEARRVATADDPDVLPAWRPYLDEIRSAAADVATSPDTVVAARAIARLGNACARCHEATNARISFPRETPPPRTDTLASDMASHQWAAAQMWEGLIGPSDDRWRAGARALAGALTLTAEGGELGVADQAARTKLLAKRAIGLPDRASRATLYGDLLATCARCHATIRDRTIPPRSASTEP